MGWPKGRPKTEDHRKKLSESTVGIKRGKRSEEHIRRLSEANKGKTVSLETRRKISEANKGRKRSEECKQRMSKLLRGNKRTLGHILSEEHKRKIGESSKGNKYALGFIHSEETRQKMSKAMKGRRFSEERKKRMGDARRGMKITGGWHHTEQTRKNMSEIKKGSKSSNWKGGVSSVNMRIRKGIEHRLWSVVVFARDNWTCQKCQERGGKLHSHHIRNFAQYPELRFAIDNGITFCKECHGKFHDRYGRKDNTEEQIKNFLTDKYNA